MYYNNNSKQKFLRFIAFLFIAITTVNAQKIERPQPKWWFGESGAVNFNDYRGTTQMLNTELSVPTAFHKGSSIKPYASLLTEYRPNKVIGGMLNVGFDNRGGTFDGVKTPCDCPANLSTNLSYITIEPSLRIAPFASAFYIFAGPTISINVRKEFTYTQLNQTETHADWSDIRKTVFSAQAGAGIDIPVSKKTSTTQMTVSPFVSFQTDLFDAPRTVETWAINTVRAGVALKIGASRKAMPTSKLVHDTVYITLPAEMAKATPKEVQFSVRAPKEMLSSRQVKETFPLRNSVFFDMGSSEIPNRYVQLTATQSASFKEAQLQQNQPNNLTTGRSARQLAVYHNILNIMGDRLRANPQSSILLTGASDKNPADGKVMAEKIKTYLVTNYGIDASRISTEGRDKPVIPSEQPGATKELALLRQGDRRVDITSTSSELLMQVGNTSSTFLKPVYISDMQADPLDSHVIFNNEGADTLLKSWKVEVTDSKGNMQYYGPYTEDHASVAGKTILGNDAQGNYKIAMIGETKTGEMIRKESSVSLSKREDIKQEGLRYSILFDFDRSKTIAAYEKFLTDEVTPLITDNATVIIHGHTDIIGDAKHNHTLSHERAMSAQQIIEKALASAGKKGIKFETFGFGASVNDAPFENNLPEERFYNRTVIIDIIPVK